MRTRAALSGIFASATILIIGWQAGTTVIAASSIASGTSTGTSSTGTSSTGTASTGTAPESTGTAAASSGAAAAASGTAAATSGTAKVKASASGKTAKYTGSSVNTRFGSVQVQISVVSGKIADVIALHLTDDGGRSVEISAQAAPILRSEVLQSQSAQVATVGGATYTSDAYLQSLQAALDQAGL